MCATGNDIGSGVVVHTGPRCGLVLVDRNTVCVGAGDVTISFGAAPVDIPAQIRFLHPLHNFALVSYDPAQLLPEVPPPPPRASGQCYLSWHGSDGTSFASCFHCTIPL